MSLGFWIRLSLMMFLQYAVWGIWLPGIAQFMGDGNGGIGLNPTQQGWIFTVYGFGAILGPFVVGQLADRYFATERVMAGCHFLGGLMLLAASYMTSFWPLFAILFIYCNLYMPTMGLSNSITFRSLGEKNQVYFPYIRLWGTIGWIVAGLVYGEYLARGDSAMLAPLFDLVGQPSFRDCLRLPAVLSIIYSIYCLSLPHTPPVPAGTPEPSAAEGTGPVVAKRSAVVESLELMKNRSFAVLIVITGLVGIMLAFYFGCENYFLGDIGIPEKRIVQYMTIGQGAELLLMFLVPVAVERLGIKTTMLIGASAWALRFILSAIGYPQWLMISTIALHGFAFGFFFVPAQMYVDKAATPDIKATAQNFLVFVVYGLGTIVGSVLSGQIRDYFSETGIIEGTGKTQILNTNWMGIWGGPAILTVLCILAFAALFREEKITRSAMHEELA